MLVEGVDFERATIPLHLIGWKALAASLSDVAAMGGRPLFALASLAVPDGRPEAAARAIMSGLLALCRRRRVALVGGDLSRSPGPIALDVTVIGRAERPVRRSGARPGDAIAVSGPLGLSALGLDRLRAGARIERSRGIERRLLLAHLKPDPDTALGSRLAALATAMIDVSDGLSTDLGHLCDASRVGAKIDLGSLPLAPPAAGSHERRLRAALHGGEDYVLLFSYPPRRRRLVEALGATPVGVITRQRGMRLRRRDGSVRILRRGGFAHF